MGQKVPGIWTVTLPGRRQARGHPLGCLPDLGLPDPRLCTLQVVGLLEGCTRLRAGTHSTHSKGVGEVSTDHGLAVERTELPLRWGGTS